VIICSENVHHRELVEKAAAAGKWILCEKPLATTAADVHAMRTACEKAKVGLGTAFPCRFSPPLMAAHDQIRSGAFGAVYAASCTNNGSMPGGWFINEKLAGGGAIIAPCHVVQMDVPTANLEAMRDAVIPPEQ